MILSGKRIPVGMDEFISRIGLRIHGLSYVGNQRRVDAR